MDKPMKRRWWRDTTTPSQLFMNPCDAVNGLTPHLVMDWTALLETFFLCVCSRVYGFPLVCESLFLDVKVTTRWHRPHPTPPPLPNSFPQKQASKQREEIIIWLSTLTESPCSAAGCIRDVHTQIPEGCLPWFHVSAWRGLPWAHNKNQEKTEENSSPPPPPNNRAHLHTGMNIFLSNFLRMVRVQIMC